MYVKISEALYKRDGHAKVITPEELTEEEYDKNYRGNIFCPHPGCKARLIFVDGKIQTKHFRTHKHDAHSKNCPNQIEYQEMLKKKYIENPECHYNISDNHMIDVLKRAYDNYLGVKKISKGKNSNGKSPEPDSTSENITTGTGSLFGQGEENLSNREPKILYRTLNELSEKDYLQIRCVAGDVSHMQLQDKFAYINFYPKNDMSISVHFGEAFIALNKPQYELFNFLKEYIEKLKRNHKKVVCCCIGEIRYMDSGMKIRPDRYYGISINGKGLYKIINEEFISNIYNNSV